MKLAVAAAALALAASPALADRLHLEGGGVVEAQRWWIEGDTLHVESESGTIGLPRSLLKRVERSSAPAAPKTTPPPPPSAGEPSEVARLMDEGNDALAARSYEIASRRFHEVMRKAPDAAGPRVGFAVAEIALGREAAALSAVLEGLTRAPKAWELHELLGDLRHREDRLEDALEAWREAFRLAPSDRLRERIEKAERELHAARDYAFSAAPHFNVRYDGEIDRDLVASLTDALELKLAELSSTYRHPPGAPITVLLYPKQAFRDVTQTPDNVVGLFDGKIRIPVGGMTRVDRGVERVLAHELTHAIVQAKTRGNCPRWLHEGLAQISEGRTLNASTRIKIGRKVRADAPETWPEAAFDYPTALSFTSYLAGLRGFDVLVSVLDRLGEGAPIDDALDAQYGKDYAGAARAWAEGLREDGS